MFFSLFRLTLLESNLNNKDGEEATNLKMLLEQKEKKNTYLQTKLTKVQAHANLLIAEQREKEKTFSDSEEKIKLLQDALQINENIMKEKDAKLKHTSNELLELHKKLQSLTNAHALEESKSSDLKCKIDSNKKLLSETLAENELVKSQLSSKVAEVRGLSDDFENKKLSLEFKMTELTKSKTLDNDQMFVKIENYENKIKSLNIEIKSKSNELVQALENNQHLESQIVLKVLEIQEKNESRQNQIEETENLKTELEEAKMNATAAEEMLNKSQVRIEVTHKCKNV